MLDEFKQQQQAAGVRERTRLTRFVAACVGLALLTVLGQKCAHVDPKPAEEAEQEGVQADGPAPARLDAEKLRESVFQTLGSGESVELTERFADDAIQWAWQSIKASPGGARVAQSSVEVLREIPLDEGLGRSYEVEAIVVAITSQVWQKEKRLWTVTLGGPDPEGEFDGKYIVAVVPGRLSDLLEGRPKYLVPQDTRAVRPVAVGDSVRVRGYYVQRRRGTVGTTPLAEPTPVLFATAWRQVIPIEDRRKPAASLEDIGFTGVRDRFLEHSRREITPHQLSVLQWAQNKGHDAIAADIKSGKLKVADWDADLFESWGKEVEADADTPRPVTDAARGKVFRIPGHLGSYAMEDWATLPVDVHGVDQLEVIDILSDYYGHNAIRTYSAFPRSAYPIQGVRNEYLTFYGVFVKNFSFEVRKPGEGQSWRTMPSFVVIHAEKQELQGASSWRDLMWILAAVIVGLGLLFWFVLVRGETKEAARMDARRIKLRKRQREAKKDDA